jgi:hypothetical protein
MAAGHEQSINSFLKKGANSLSVSDFLPMAASTVPTTLYTLQQVTSQQSINK